MAAQTRGSAAVPRLLASGRRGRSSSGRRLGRRAGRRRLVGLAPAAARPAGAPPWPCRGWPPRSGSTRVATALRGERWLRLLRDAGARLSRTDAYARHHRRLHGQQRAARPRRRPAEGGAELAPGGGSDRRRLRRARRRARPRRGRARRDLRGARDHPEPAARRRGLDAGGRRRRAGPGCGRRRLPRARHRRRSRAAGARGAAARADASPVVGDRRSACWCCRSSCGSSRAPSTPSWARWPACTSRCSTASTSWPWPTSWRSSRPRPATSGTFDAAVLLGVRLVAGGTHAAALAYAVVVRFVLFVPITVVGLVVLVVRYGGLRRVSVALRRPATAVRGALAPLRPRLEPHAQQTGAPGQAARKSMVGVAPLAAEPGVHGPHEPRQHRACSHALRSGARGAVIHARRAARWRAGPVAGHGLRLRKLRLRACPAPPARTSSLPGRAPSSAPRSAGVTPSLPQLLRRALARCSPPECTLRCGLPPRC